MNEPGKSDRPIVPGKSPNKISTPMAEEMEGRGLAKGNLGQQNAPRTQRRISAPSELAQIRQTAKSNKDVKFTALMHHIYRVDTLRFAYSQLKRHAAAGVDGETWQHYGEDLEIETSMCGNDSNHENSLFQQPPSVIVSLKCRLPGGAFWIFLRVHLSIVFPKWCPVRSFDRVLDDRSSLLFVGLNPGYIA